MIVEKGKKTKRGSLIISYRYRNAQSARSVIWLVLILSIITFAVLLNWGEPLLSVGSVVIAFLCFLFYVVLVERVNKIEIWLRNERLIVRNKPLPRLNWAENLYKSSHIAEAFLKITRNRHSTEIPNVMLKLKNGKERYWLMTSSISDAGMVVDEVNKALRQLQNK